MTFQEATLALDNNNMVRRSNEDTASNANGSAWLKLHHWNGRRFLMAQHIDPVTGEVSEHPAIFDWDDVRDSSWETQDAVTEHIN